MLSPQLLELLRAWWREGRRRRLLLRGGWLFPGRNPVEPLSARQFCRVVQAAAQAAGIKKRVSPPRLRDALDLSLDRERSNQCPKRKSQKGCSCSI
jgi:integrase